MEQPSAGLLDFACVQARPMISVTTGGVSRGTLFYSHCFFMAGGRGLQALLVSCNYN